VAAEGVVDHQTGLHTGIRGRTLPSFVLFPRHVPGFHVQDRIVPSRRLAAFPNRR
jgi:hypothetical protein